MSGNPNKKSKAQRRLWWKEPNVTAAFAATLARASRTEAFKKLYPEPSKKYLQQAEKAWNFCMKNADNNGNPNPQVGKFHYGAKNGGIDEYIWMAVELWLTTGEEKYHQYLKKQDIDKIVKDSWLWSWWPLHETYGMVIRAYVYGKRSGKDPVILKKFKDNILKAAASTMGWQKNWAIRSSFSNAPYKFKTWGWYFLSDVASYDLLLATTLVNKEKAKQFVNAACFNADQELGNNPDNFVSITGIGKKRITDHVHQNSRFDGIIEPVPGIPLGFFPARAGTHWHKLPMWDFTHGGLPISYRAIDAWTISQEFTVPNLATTIMTYAMLADAENGLSGAPSLTITANFL